MTELLQLPTLIRKLPHRSSTTEEDACDVAKRRALPVKPSPWCAPFSISTETPPSHSLVAPVELSNKSIELELATESSSSSIFALFDEAVFERERRLAANLPPLCQSHFDKAIAEAEIPTLAPAPEPRQPKKRKRQSAVFEEMCTHSQCSRPLDKYKRRFLCNWHAEREIREHQKEGCRLYVRQPYSEGLKDTLICLASQPTQSLFTGGQCAFDGCGVKRRLCKNLCPKHYQAQRRAAKERKLKRFARQ